MAGIGAVLLAAGASTRFTAGNKLLADLGGKPLVTYPAEAIAAARVDEIVVVTGRDAAHVRRALAAIAVRFVHNDDWAAGMGGSICVGIRAIGAQISGAFIVPGDMPLLTPGLLVSLRDAFVRAGSDRIVVPTTAVGAQRNPVLWPRQYFSELVLLSGPEGGKPLLRRHADRIVEVRVADPDVFADVDTEGELAAARRQLALKGP
jgi:molybdenum cofactor cytidylyltransferase